VGDGAGSNYTTEGSNIVIGSLGTPGDSDAIRIGSSQTATYIAGILNASTGDGTTSVLIDTITGQLLTNLSSERFKRDIQDMGSASEAILALRPVSFHFRTDSKDRPQYGLVAEEVAKIAPNLVVRDKNNQIYSVRYEAVNAMLLNEFQKQHDEVENQKKVIADLKSEIATLTAEQKDIEALKAQFQALQKAVDKK